MEAGLGESLDLLQNGEYCSLMVFLIDVIPCIPLGYEIFEENHFVFS